MLRKALVLATLFATPALAQELRMQPGESRMVALAENPSTGYSWRLDAAASKGLDRLAITDQGHEKGRNLPGAPGTHAWRIEALEPGKATIHFAYRRPWEPAPVETRRIRVEILP